MELTDFDKDFYNSLAEKDAIVIDPKGVFHTIIEEGKKAGVVGFIPTKFDEKSGFVQIIIIPEFRGQGLVLRSEDALRRKYFLDKLYATIDKKNIGSIKAHQKTGFEMETEEAMYWLRKGGYLGQDQVRLVKKYH